MIIYITGMIQKLQLKESVRWAIRLYMTKYNTVHLNTVTTLDDGKGSIGKLARLRAEHGEYYINVSWHHQNTPVIYVELLSRHLRLQNDCSGALQFEGSGA